MCLHFHFLAGCLNLGSATCSSCQVNTTLKSSSTVMVIVWKIYILKNRYHQYCIQIIIDMIVVDMQICILKSSSAPPTLLCFLTLIFPSPPHLLLQSGHHHHRFTAIYFVIILIIIIVITLPLTCSYNQVIITIIIILINCFIVRFINIVIVLTSPKS